MLNKHIERGNYLAHIEGVVLFFIAEGAALGHLLVEKEYNSI